MCGERAATAGHHPDLPLETSDAMPRNLTCTSASSARPATRGPHAGVSDARPRRALALLAPLALALGVSLAACAERGPDPAADAAAAQVPGNLPATSVGPVDPTSVRDKLAGSWVVRRAGRVVLEFSLDGDRIALTDRRFPAPRQLEGAFRVRSDTGFGVETADGTTYWYSAAWVGSDVHIGLGTAIAVESLDRFTAHLGAWERLERTPEACVYVRTWGPNATRTDVPCEVTERGGGRCSPTRPKIPFGPTGSRRWSSTSSAPTSWIGSSPSRSPCRASSSSERPRPRSGWSPRTRRPGPRSARRAGRSRCRSGRRGKNWPQTCAEQSWCAPAEIDIGCPPH